MEDEDCGDIFHQDQKIFRFFCLFCLDFLEDGSDKQNIGKMGDFWGDRKLRVFFEVIC